MALIFDNILCLTGGPGALFWLVLKLLLYRVCPVPAVLCSAPMCRSSVGPPLAPVGFSTPKGPRALGPPVGSLPLSPSPSPSLQALHQGGRSSDGLPDVGLEGVDVSPAPEGLDDGEGDAGQDRSHSCSLAGTVGGDPGRDAQPLAELPEVAGDGRGRRRASSSPCEEVPSPLPARRLPVPQEDVGCAQPRRVCHALAQTLPCPGLCLGAEGERAPVGCHVLHPKRSDLPHAGDRREGQDEDVEGLLLAPCEPLGLGPRHQEPHDLEADRLRGLLPRREGLVGVPSEDGELGPDGLLRRGLHPALQCPQEAPGVAEEGLARDSSQQRPEIPPQASGLGRPCSPGPQPAGLLPGEEAQECSLVLLAGPGAQRGS